MYIKDSPKSFEKAAEGMHYVNIPFWSLSIIFFKKNYFTVENHFSTIFSDSEDEKSIFKGFLGKDDFQPRFYDF